jgi:hypothetical protein
MVALPDGTLTRDSRTTSITSFLCTKAAQDIFAVGKAQLDAFRVTELDFRPPARGSALSNLEILREAQSFVTRSWRG